VDVDADAGGPLDRALHRREPVLVAEHAEGGAGRVARRLEPALELGGERIPVLRAREAVEFEVEVGLQRRDRGAPELEGRAVSLGARLVPAQHLGETLPRLLRSLATGSLHELAVLARVPIA